ncbi:methylated-DNA--[protein]-cysteine S-methyltransferase [Streptomyces sp. NPDC059679]|uniref:methylated-DNA--[protein]-cysteine S-methyltransferase n=1 Tax=Streptomyces sp. NPDC059679 TaxID=3346903 RepID=UPI0036AE7723
MTISEGPGPAISAEQDGPTERREARAWCWSVLDSPIGPLLLATTDQGLAQVVFHADGATAAKAVSRLTARLGTAPEPDPAFGAGSPADSAAGAVPDRVAHLGSAVHQLESYFADGLREFTVPLDWSLTTGFNRRVLRELADHIPYGTVVGYGELADRVGDPGAARAVGVAMGSNPLPVVVPCHRVVESGGGIGGFGGGLETKRTLLALEGILPQPLF